MATLTAMNTVQMLVQTLAAPASLTQFTQASSITCTFIFFVCSGHALRIWGHFSPSPMDFPNTQQT